MEKELFELMTKMYSEMKENMATKEDVKSIRQDIVRLENKMDDKLELKVLRNNLHLPSTYEK